MKEFSFHLLKLFCDQHQSRAAWLNFSYLSKGAEAGKELTGRRLSLSDSLQKAEALSGVEILLTTVFLVTLSSKWHLAVAPCPQAVHTLVLSSPEPATGPEYAAELTLPHEDKPRAARLKERTPRSLTKTGNCRGRVVRIHILLRIYHLGQIFLETLYFAQVQSFPSVIIRK